MREARKRAGLPQDAVGVRIGLDESTASARISRYEGGIHEPPYDVAVKVANVLDVPTAFLYCENDELAGLILAWGKLDATDQKRLKLFVEQEFASTKI